MTRVLLTGGNGFVASHILNVLLQRGHSVVTTVRSQEKIEIVKHAHPEVGKDRLDFVIVKDIAAPGAFDEALKSHPPFAAVIHTASPFHFDVTDVQKELLDPAIMGTTGILKSIKGHAPTVKTVVVTSTFAAMFNPFKGNWPEHTYSEEDWNPMTLEQSLANPIMAYTGSKLLAERAAWVFVEHEQPQFTLSTIVPPWVLGPNPHGLTNFNVLNTSSKYIASFIIPGMREKFPFGGVFIWADARDVALGHVLAMENLEAAGKRFFFTAGHFSNKEIARIIKENFPEYKEVVDSYDHAKDDFPAGRYFGVDNSRAKKLLEGEFTSFEKCIVDCVRSLKGLKG